MPIENEVTAVTEKNNNSINLEVMQTSPADIQKFVDNGSLNDSRQALFEEAFPMDKLSNGTERELANQNTDMRKQAEKECSKVGLTDYLDRIKAIVWGPEGATDYADRLQANRKNTFDKCVEGKLGGK